MYEEERDGESSEKEKKERAKNRKGKKNKPYHLGIEIIKLIVIGMIIVLSSVAVYYFFFYSSSCENKDCFYSALVSCERVKWINDAQEASWLYTIEGKGRMPGAEDTEAKCIVAVKLLQGKKGTTDIMSAEGKEMKCYIPLGTSTVPGQKLEFCTGELKEELQNLIIKRMHKYLLENLEGINEEIGNLTSTL